MAVLTHLELSKKYANPKNGPPRPDWQHEENARFFAYMWSVLDMGGHYIWPGARVVLKKVEGGWEPQEQR